MVMLSLEKKNNTKQTNNLTGATIRLAAHGKDKKTVSCLKKKKTKTAYLVSH